jgi:hypothetical protein
MPPILATGLGKAFMNWFTIGKKGLAKKRGAVAPRPSFLVALKHIDSVTYRL